MKFQANINIAKPDSNIHFNDKILLIGSCFTEHIGNALIQTKFDVVQNPSGILFDPISVCNNLSYYLENIQWNSQLLHCHDELFYSWFHHGDFANISAQKVVSGINKAHQIGHEHLLSADWLIITLGSSFVYRLLHDNLKSVANCHRAPAHFFDKYLLQSNEIVNTFNKVIQNIRAVNSNIKIIFTISPVRHLRDGLIDNNKSKARLIEAVHNIVENNSACFYFPAYELVIDVLRDYRYYDIDLSHPNYLATSFVLSHFKQTYFNEETVFYFEEVQALKTAQKHKSINPETKAHKDFMNKMKIVSLELQNKYPIKNFEEEIQHFSISTTSSA